MKTALIADLHANREALDAVLDHARGQGAQAWALLGDFVGYGADPGWVVDQVRALVADGAIAVQGNHDQAVAHGASSGMHPDARQVVEWTRAQLDADQLAFLTQLPMCCRHGDRLFVHANAVDPSGWAYVATRADAMRSLAATDCRYVFCGHEHGPRLYHGALSGHVGEFVPSPGVAIPVPPHRRWLAIPGSAGQPRDGNPAACYAVFDDAAVTIAFHRVPYDHVGAGAKILAAALPPRLATRLGDGG